MDIPLHLFDIGLGKALERRKALKQRGRYLVYACIRALRGKAHRKQKFIILFIIKRTIGQGISLLQKPDYLQNLLLCAHKYHLFTVF